MTNEVNIFTLQWDGYDVDDKFHRIVACGRDEAGRTAAFVVDDYPIQVFMQLGAPNGFEWKDKKAINAINEFFNKQFGTKRKHRVLDGWDTRSGMKPEVHYYHGVRDVLRKKSSFITGYYRTEHAVRELTSTLATDSARIVVNKEKYAVVLAHDKFEPVKKLTVDAKLPWAGWIKCTGRLVNEEEEKITTQDVEIHCSWKSLVADADCKTSCYESGLWYDEETLGIGLQFPNKLDPRCPITQISYTYRDPNHNIEQSYCVIYGDAKPRTKEGEKVPIVINVENEKQLLLEHCKMIIERNPDVISGYNTLGFDEEYFAKRARIHDIDLPISLSRIKDLAPKYYDKSWGSSNAKKIDVKFVHYPGRLHMDVYKIAKGTLKLSNYKLNTVALEKLGEGKHDVSVGEMFEAHRDHHRLRGVLSKCTKDFDDKGRPIRHDNVTPAVWSRLLNEYHATVVRLQEIVVYCMKDTYLSMRLYDVFKYMQTAREFANEFQVRVSEVFTRGQGFRALSLLYTRVREQNVIINQYEYESFEGKYEGALNLGTKYGKKGRYDDLASLDVASMYPSQMRKHNVSPDTEITAEEANTVYKGRCKLHVWKDYEGKANERSYSAWLVDSSVRRGFYPKMLDDLIEKRRAIKRMMESAVGTPDYYIYDAKQLAVKIVMNSMYGLIGSDFSKVPCKHLASLVTWLSRQELMKVVNFLENGGPPAEWLEERRAKENDTSTSAPMRLFPPLYPPATIVYGDTDSVQFHYPQTQFESKAILADFYHDLTWAVNQYLSPISVELEKIGTLILEQPKHYAMRIIDQQKTLRINGVDVPNPKYGKWKPGFRPVGIDIVKRNQCEFHRECLKRILTRVLDDGSMYEEKYTNIQERERVILNDNVDDLLTTLYKVYNEIYDAKDYEIYEEYTREGVDSVIGKLARRQADLGRPIKVGERVGYVMVSYINEPKKVVMGEKARILGDFNVGDRIDTRYYIERMQRPYDSMITACHESKIFKAFWREKAVKLGSKLNIRRLVENPERDPDELFCEELRNKLNKTKYKDFEVPQTYSQLRQIIQTNDYATLYTRTTRSQVTRNINELLAQGWELVLPNSTLVAKFLSALNHWNSPMEFLEAVLSVEAYRSLEKI